MQLSLANQVIAPCRPRLNAAGPATDASPYVEATAKPVNCTTSVEETTGGESSFGVRRDATTLFAYSWESGNMLRLLMTFSLTAMAAVNLGETPMNLPTPHYERRPDDPLWLVRS